MRAVQILSYLKLGNIVNYAIFQWAIIKFIQYLVMVSLPDSDNDFFNVLADTLTLLRG